MELNMADLEFPLSPLYTLQIIFPKWIVHILLNREKSPVMSLGYMKESSVLQQFFYTSFFKQFFMQMNLPYLQSLSLVIQWQSHSSKEIAICK